MRLPTIFRKLGKPTTGHFGDSKIFSRISEIYYWPVMRKSIYNYVRKCSICAASKSENLPQATLMGSNRNINFPFQLISTDLLGPYQRSKSKNEYVLVVVDWFTKFELVHQMATSWWSTRFLENNAFLIFVTIQM